MNVLLVGSDSRANVTGDLAETTGKDEVSGQRSDTIMVLHVDPKAVEGGHLLDPPRPLRADRGRPTTPTGSTPPSPSAARPGPHRHHRGGARLPHQPLRRGRLRRLPRHRQRGRTGSRSTSRRRCGTRSAGLSIDDPGCVKLDGDAGLAFVRSRNYETYESGEWQTDPTADLGRIQRQQDFIRRMLRKAVSSGLSNPLTLNRLIGIGVRDVTLDDRMTHRRHRPPGPPVQVPRRRHRRHADLPHRRRPTSAGRRCCSSRRRRPSPTSTASTGIAARRRRPAAGAGPALRHPGAGAQRLRRRRRRHRGQRRPHRGRVQRGRPGRRRLLQLLRHRDPATPRGPRPRPTSSTSTSTAGRSSRRTRRCAPST